MHGTIVPFPTAVERADIQLRRHGETDLTRGQDEAISLFAIASGGTVQSTAMDARLKAFEFLVSRLAVTRPEAVEDFVILNDAGLRISLAAMPELLKAMLRSSKLANCNASNPN